MQKISLNFSLLLLTLTTYAFGGEINVRPGLWQITTSSDLLLLFPHIPADQMQSINDMAKQYGLELPEIEAGDAISQACITEEMATKQTLPVLAQNELGCVTKNATRAGADYKAEFICDSANFKGNVMAEATVMSTESFTGKTQFTGDVQGNPVNEQAKLNGKWLNASCGAVKPL